MLTNKSYRILLKVIVIAILILLASLIGRNRAQESQKQLLAKHFPDTLYNLEPINTSKWLVRSKVGNNESNIYIGEGNGYNGKVSVLVKTGADTVIDNVIILTHNETVSYFKKLGTNNFFKKITGKDVFTFLEKEPVDVISGATISSIAVIQAIQVGYSNGENILFAQPTYPKFGLLEILVLLLLTMGLIIVKIKNKKIKKYLLWASMLLSFILLGLVYNQHITLSRVSAILNGYFPSLYNELYFYILLFGSILIILLTRKNIYCHSVCPFGVAQGILAKTGNAKTYRPKYYNHLKLLQGFIALVVLLISLALNNPTIAQYEVFGAFFQLTANTFLFGLLFIVIILSLFIYKPWCNFMCPIDSVFTYIDHSRKSIVKIWKKES